MLNPEDSERFRQAIIEGEKWVKDRPNILAPEYFTLIKETVHEGIIFGLHCHYRGGGSPSAWAALDFEQFESYLSHSRPGDLYFAWSGSHVAEKDLVLAHAQYRDDMVPGELILSPEALAKLRRYLEQDYNEFIAVYISWQTRQTECDFGDVDSYEDFMACVTRYSRPHGEVFVFPLTLIDKPEYYLVRAKYPNENGEVPKGGAY